MAAHGIIIFLVLLNVYLLAIYWLKRDEERMERWGLSLFGPALMMRTKKGRALIDRLARHKRFWKRFGDVCIWTVVAFGVLMVGLLVWALTRVTDVPAGAEPTVQQVLFIPGINPFVPIGYGIFALAIAIVIHEFAHGILARAHDLKVKSLGLLMFIVPVGAFMEPDEDELKAAHPRARTRVFAAGAGTSILISFVFAGIYSFGMIPMVQPAAPGLGIVDVSPGSPADGVNIRPGMILMTVDGRDMEDLDAFQEAFNGTEPGDTVALTIHSNGDRYTVRPELADRFEFVRQQCLDEEGTTEEQCQARAEQDFLAVCRSRGHSRETCQQRLEDGDVHLGFLGVSPTSPEAILSIHRPVPSADRSLEENVARVMLYVFLPVGFFSPVNSPVANFYVVEGPMAALGLGGFWLVANSMYWLFWVNFILGTFNALPLTVLDGGHVFQEGVRKLLRRKDPPPDPDHVEMRVQQATKAMALLIVGMIVLQLVIPWVVNRVL